MGEKTVRDTVALEILYACYREDWRKTKLLMAYTLLNSLHYHDSHTGTLKEVMLV